MGAWMFEKVCRFQCCILAAATTYICKLFWLKPQLTTVKYLKNCTLLVQINLIRKQVFVTKLTLPVHCTVYITDTDSLRDRIFGTHKRNSSSPMIIPMLKIHIKNKTENLDLI